ncbi:MAG: hypothetical protein ACXABI_14950 [Candidatus Hodarchaeales archaeon]|jgi:hypothetical protein
MAKQKYDKYLKAREEDNTSVKMVTEATKAILQYVKNFAEGLNQLNEEIMFLMERVERLEKKMGVKSKRKKKKQKKGASFSLPPPPSVSYGGLNDEPAPVESYPSTLSPQRGEPEDVKSELRSVLAGGVKLKSVEEGKREHYQELQSAVFEEFKQTGRPTVKEKVYSPPPLDSKKQKKKKKADDKAVAKLRKELARDLENTFGK